MGRHSDGKNNYRLSSGAILVLIIIVALLISALWFFSARKQESVTAQGPSCVSGQLRLPIASSDEVLVQPIIDSFNNQSPTSRDYCVQAELVDSLDNAALYLAPEGEDIDAILSEYGRTAATPSPAVISTVALGVAGQLATNPTSLDLQNIVFPVQSQPAASAKIASLLSESDDEAIYALQNQHTSDSEIDSHVAAGKYLATAQMHAAENLVFTPLEQNLAINALPLHPNEQTDEDQSRAAQDFITTLSGTQDEVTSPLSPRVFAAAQMQRESLHNTGEHATKSATQGPNHSREADTLFVVDTSENIAPYFDTAQKAIGEAAKQVADAGYQVALSNYSSPLNPGVTKGWRRNIAMNPDPAEVANSVELLGTGGVPHAREALLAAVKDAAALQRPVNLVFITTGTADIGDDDDYQRRVNAAKSADTLITVVHVGDAVPDSAIAELADRSVTVDQPESLPEVMQRLVSN